MSTERHTRPEERTSAAPGSGPWSASVSRAVREALEAYATPEVASAILFDALRRAQLSALPDDAAGLVAFASRELSAAVDARLGASAAAEIEERLGMLGKLVGRAERTSEPRMPAAGGSAVGAAAPARPALHEVVPSQRAAPTGPPAPMTEPFGASTMSLGNAAPVSIALVSSDREVAASVEEALGPSGQVVVYRNLVALALATRQAPHAVIVDRRDGPPGATLILPNEFASVVLLVWPVESTASDALRTANRHVAHVACVGSDVLVSDLGPLARMLVAARATG